MRIVSICNFLTFEIDAVARQCKIFACRKEVLVFLGTIFKNSTLVEAKKQEFWDIIREEVNTGKWDEEMLNAGEEKIIYTSSVRIALEKLKHGKSALENTLKRTQNQAESAKAKQSEKALEQIALMRKDAEITPEEREELNVQSKVRQVELASLTDEISNFFYSKVRDVPGIYIIPA